MLAGGDPRLNYSLGELLGEGSYGSVFSAFPSFETKHHYDVFAVKIIPISIDGNTTEIEKEIAFLRSLKSPYIVSFVESFLIGGELWIIMECCGGGSLADINQVTKLDESAIKAILAFSILGLDFLHKTKKVIHRDIKPGNILLTLDGKAKLSDFGVSAQLSSTLMRRKTVIGSPYWMAPGRN
jgi:serine/threonine kinase 3